MGESATPALARARVCATCAKSSPVITKYNAYDTGFVRCADLPAWRWLPGHNHCQFQPERWEARAA